MTQPDDMIRLDPIESDPMDQPQPPEEGLGEFTETIIDADGQLDPELLEEPSENDD